MDETEINKQYGLYKRSYRALRKKGLVKENQRIYSKKTFIQDMEKNKVSAETVRKNYLEYQKKTGALTEKEIDALWKQYKKQGYKVSTMDTKGQGVVEEGKTVSTKFRSKKTMLKNLTAKQLIALRVDSGKTREEALEEYGY